MDFTFFILDDSGSDEKPVFYIYSLIFNYWSYFWLNHMLYMLYRGLISLHWKYFISMLFIISLLKTILCHSVEVYIHLYNLHVYIQIIDSAVIQYK